MALSPVATENGGVMRIHNESVTPELRPIFTGALIAFAALALSFIATALALEPRATNQKPRPAVSDVHRAR
jgi:hypothetical protein